MATLKGQRFHNRKGQDLPSFNATAAKNAFGRVLETALREGAVLITKHNDPKAVLMSWEEFESLASANSSQLAALTKEFDELLLRMQTPNSRKAVQAAFDLGPESLGKAAVSSADRRG